MINGGRIYIQPGGGRGGGNGVRPGSGGGTGQPGRTNNNGPLYYDPIILPPGTDSRVPDKQADPAKEKENNKTEDIIEIDDL